MKIKEGGVYETEKYGPIKVLKYSKWDDVDIKFLRTDSIKKVEASYVRRGNIRDLESKTIFGVGFNCERSDTTSRAGISAQKVWYGMLSRCYDENSKAYPNYGGRGVHVCKDWHDFKKYEQWFVKNYREGFFVDKDIIKYGNKIYCPDYCRFVPPEINAMVQNNKRQRKSNLKPGVCYRNKKYIARYSDRGQRIYLGRFNTEDEAYSAYLDAKSSAIQRVAEDYYLRGNIDFDVYQSLIKWTV